MQTFGILAFNLLDSSSKTLNHSIKSFKSLQINGKASKTAKATKKILTPEEQGEAEQRALALALVSGKEATVLEFYSPKCRLCNSLLQFVMEVEARNSEWLNIITADAENEKWLREVDKITETFSSVKQYLASYKYPLIKETQTQADMLSNMKTLPQAPTCEILSVEASTEFKEPKDLYYNLYANLRKENKKEKDPYKSQTGDVFALLYVRPTHIDDLNRPPRCYLPAIVVKVDEDDPSKIKT